MNVHRRSGISALELLVVISIIVLLMAIAVPAVQYAREASRKNQCQSRLANLGRALHNYEAAHKSYPPAVQHDPGRPGRSVHQYAAHVLLLPYLDQLALYRQIDVSQRFICHTDPRVMDERAGTRVDVFLCPSDWPDRGTNYRVCMGPEAGMWDFPGLAETRYGPFVGLRHRRAAEFEDGLSNTIAMSEKLKGAGRPDRYSQRRDFWYSGLSNLYRGYYYPSAEEMIAACSSLSGEPAYFSAYSGWSWLCGAYDYTWYNHLAGPNADVPNCADVSWTPTGRRFSLRGLYNASSNHAGGVNCLIMDGTVRFVADEIDLGVWQALATRAGGELVETAALQ